MKNKDNNNNNKKKKYRLPDRHRKFRSIIAFIYLLYLTSIYEATLEFHLHTFFFLLVVLIFIPLPEDDDDDKSKK